ncbi:MAG: hypothetical protein N4J56_007753 [Chroococcidiopsis sp. SAG 2025]|uniref:hypothetical protein n=1 Tax=Chroococcidiopsis sp. SAG 2025 TaxID=171389 RepID=UPI002937374C|nr:hypothetical protein [Chroococcidiopsis sp. SAG 2025]MDV2998048.1 hypothetical protein [Chroococcidiopsis sp. SAG 2025]
MNHQSGNYLVISFLTLRKAIGCLGMALPFVLALGGMLLFQLDIQSSISGYYHTGMRDVFVGTLCAIGIFLWGYKGYDHHDNRASNIAGFSAIGVALFPTSPISPSSIEKFIGGVHIVFAASFFISLALISLFLFTKSEPSKRPTPRKLQRNLVYRLCGYTMLAAMVLITIVGLLPKSAMNWLENIDPLFWLESAAIFAFGVSWFVKGEGILEDTGKTSVDPK